MQTNTLPSRSNRQQTIANAAHVATVRPFTARNVSAHGRHPMTGFPLAQADDGEQIEIVSVDGGLGAQRKLTDLGLSPGQRAIIITRQPGGPVLLALGGTRIAVGFGLALKVKVVPVTDRGEDG